MGILAAYAHRLKTGEGQWVETSLFEAAMVQTYWQSAIALATGVAPRAMGSAHPLNAPYQAFEASDGWIVVGGANQKQLAAHRSKRSARPNSPRTRASLKAGDRMAHLKELEAELSKRFPHEAVRPLAGCCSKSKGVPCGPVNDMLQALSDPQTLAREMVVEVDHSTLGAVKTIGLPVKFSAYARQGAQRPRRSTASTRARSCANTASAQTRSPPSKRRARSSLPRPRKTSTRRQGRDSSPTNKQ